MARMMFPNFSTGLGFMRRFVDPDGLLWDVLDMDPLQIELVQVELAHTDQAQCANHG